MRSDRRESVAQLTASAGWLLPDITLQIRCRDTEFFFSHYHTTAATTSAALVPYIPLQIRLS